MSYFHIPNFINTESCFTNVIMIWSLWGKGECSSSRYYQTELSLLQKHSAQTIYNFLLLFFFSLKTLHCCAVLCRLRAYIVHIMKLLINYFVQVQWRTGLDCGLRNKKDQFTCKAGQQLFNGLSFQQFIHVMLNEVKAQPPLEKRNSVLTNLCFCSCIDG